MAPQTQYTPTYPVAGTLDWRRRWPDWIGALTALWSLLYAALALSWTIDVSRFPLGDHDPHPENSLLGGLQAVRAAPTLAILGLVSTGIALLIARRRGPPIFQWVMLGWAWVVALVLLVVIPDGRMLIALAYAPLFLVGAPFNWPPVNYLEVALPWTVVHQIICCAGGFLWAATALTEQRSLRHACRFCGRREMIAGWTTPAAAARWGRWAIALAIVHPVSYALIRWAWAAGVPLGISEEFLAEMHATGLWLAGAGLATVAAGGALLTLGLVQRWGEIFPHWVPFLADTRVPPALAIVPASIVAVSVFSGGLTAVQMRWADYVNGAWLANPLALFPVWGLALGAATLAYYYRRRGRCAQCGRGAESAG